MFALKVEDAAWLRFSSLSYTVRGNLLLAGSWLACYVAFYLARADADLAVLPFYMLLIAFGSPWEVFDHFDATNVHPHLFSFNNIFYEALNVRGGFINVTLVCLFLDASRWGWMHFRAHERGSGPASAWSAHNTMATLAAVSTVGAMAILPWTPFARSQFLRNAWIEASNQRLLGIYARGHADPGPRPSRFPDSLQQIIDGQSTAEKRDHLTQLAMAIEDSVAVDLGNGIAVSKVEQEMSAALLCVARSSQYEDYRQGDVIGGMLNSSIDTPARVHAYSGFLRQTGPSHSLPAGGGCRASVAPISVPVLVPSQRLPLSQTRPGIHLAIGDTEQSVADALHVTDQPTHTTIQDRSVGEIRLQRRGIWIFLDASNRAYEFRFDAPFAGYIDRSRIGIGLAEAASALGPPFKEFSYSPLPGTSYLYAPQPGETIRIDFDAAGRAKTISVLAGSVTLSESGTPPSLPPAQARPVYRGVSSAMPRVYLPARGVITRFRSMDHSTRFPDPTVPEVLDLGRLSGGVNSSYASAVSANGKVVVGSANHGNYSDVAFTWTLATGMVSLDQSFFIRPFAYASAVSGDGSVVVGAQAVEQTGMMRAFRWTRETGIVKLGILPGTDRSEAQSMSAEGNVVVGLSGGTAFRWTKATGMVALPGRSIFGPVVVTGDGKTVYGTELDSSGFHVIRWDSDGSVIRYSNPPGVSASFAEAVSSDGSVLVGLQLLGKNHQALATAWYSPSEITHLGSLRGGTYSKATGVNANGSIIVGVAADGSTHGQSTVFRWTRATGMQSLADWIVSRGGSSPPSNPIEAGGVSADGSTVVGSLRNGDPFVAVDPHPQVP